VNINTVTLTGNLTKDPELKSVRDQSFAVLRLAVNKSSKQDGQWVDVPMFFDVSVWGRVAEVCVQYLVKGSHIAISGRLDWREWTSEAGEKRQSVSIVADRVELPSKREAEQSAGYARQEAPRQAAPAPTQREQHHQETAQTFADDDDDSTIPF
jgi:single-strand DNA-binding protein